MTVWVDADSMPTRIREIIVRQATRRGFAARFVANRRIPVRQSANVKLIQSDDADETIVQSARDGDMVVTRDIPLAARLLENGLVVLNDRGAVFTQETIRERLSQRDFIKELRDTGLYDEQRRTHGEREVQNFANGFDRELTRRGLTKSSSRLAPRSRNG